MTAELIFASAITNEPLLQDAVHRLETRLAPQLHPGGSPRPAEAPPDLAILFFSSHFRDQADALRAEIQALYEPRCLIGCTAEGVIGGESEFERQPAISLMLAYLPGVTLTTFRLSPHHWRPLPDREQTFCEAIGAPPDTRLFMLLADPFTTPMGEVLEPFNDCFPGVPMVGGMASGGMSPGYNILLLNGEVWHAGAVGVAFSGQYEVDLVVSQGCRPIGEPFTVTAANRNVILTLADQPAIFKIQQIVDELSEEEQELLRNGLFIGRAIDSSRETLGRGDFLVRGVMGVDRQSGAITIGDNVEVGEKVQFHVRDAVTAQEDLEMLLIPQAFRPPASGALLFSCNGRGLRLYDHPDGDISIVRGSLGDVPVAGFFCAGEIGPVGGSNFLHGHTVSLAIFRPANEN
jgi:small ligand-binding sensory domain FIST